MPRGDIEPPVQLPILGFGVVLILVMRSILLLENCEANEVDKKRRLLSGESKNCQIHGKITHLPSCCDLQCKPLLDPLPSVSAFWCIRCNS